MRGEENVNGMALVLVKLLLIINLGLLSAILSPWDLVTNLLISCHF